MAGSAAQPKAVAHETVEQRQAKGKRQRETVPLSWHSQLELAPDRDPIGLLASQAASRVQELVPIRYGRMLESPFAFYRGAALPMAADLSLTPTTHLLETQLCGDAHLSNFGAFGAPDRRLVFDVNDFDETHPGPFEWDVKRLAASVEIAGRVNGYKARKRREAVLATVESYRTHMRRLAKRDNLDVWYERIEYETILEYARGAVGPAAWQRLSAAAAKATSRNSIQVLGKLTQIVDGEPRFVATPPLLVPLRDLAPEGDQRTDEELIAWLRQMMRRYRTSLQYDRRILLEQFRLVDAARKVVGVGSVGTRAWVLLMLGRDNDDPLFLQAKEAQQSVLAPYVETTHRFRNEGERVVAGQHIMQAASDIFLGSLRANGADGFQRDFYVRQLRDWKMSANPSIMEPETMLAYGAVCGRSLARAHARGGDRIAIASYLGSSDKFDVAVAEFASRYADVTEADHAALAAAAESGRITAERGL
jgi:uncharacterized protein (DUF2252 family)